MISPFFIPPGIRNLSRTAFRVLEPFRRGCPGWPGRLQEQFRTGYRLALARLLIGRDNARAAHELQKVVAARRAQGLATGRELQSLLAQVADTQPTTDTEQQDFYKRMATKYPV